jgi:hypothetical protein
MPAHKITSPYNGTYLPSQSKDLSKGVAQQVSHGNFKMPRPASLRNFDCERFLYAPSAD